MKKIISVLLVVLMLSLMSVSALENDVQTMYAPDGREIVVYKTEVQAYKNVGWFENKSDVVKTMYAPDGREISVYISEVSAYKSVGWFENKSDVTQTMYAPDGREIIIYKSEVSAYKSVGWFDDKNDVTAVMCAADGRKITVYKSQVQEYINVGWMPVQGNKIDPSKPMVAITFDDGPRPASTGSILNTLEKFNAKATFFVLGNLAKSYPEVLKRMQSLGCQIGNHSYSHPDLATLSPYNVSVQLNTTAEIISGITGFYPTVVRPPYGSYNNTVLSAAGKPLILWSIDTLDWKHRNASYVANAALSKVSDGDIILMHDIYDSTAGATAKIVPELIRRGFQLVTVDELAAYKNGGMQSYKTYSRFR